MPQELDTLIGEVGEDRHSLTHESVRGAATPGAAESKLDSFVAVLWKMTSDERISASRYGASPAGSCGSGRPATPTRCR